MIMLMCNYAANYLGIYVNGISLEQKYRAVHHNCLASRMQLKLKLWNVLFNNLKNTIATSAIKLKNKIFKCSFFALLTGFCTCGLFLNLINMIENFWPFLKFAKFFVSELNNWHLHGAS